jgi:hypothetical protein
METLYPDVLRIIYQEILNYQPIDDLIRFYDSLPKNQKSYVKNWIQREDEYLLFKTLKECVIQFIEKLNKNIFDDLEGDYDFAPFGYDYNIAYHTMVNLKLEFLKELTTPQYVSIMKKYSPEEYINSIDFCKMKNDETLDPDIRKLAKELDTKYYKLLSSYVDSMKSIVIESMNMDQFFSFYKYIQFMIEDIRYDDEEEQLKILDDYFYCIKRKIKYFYVKFDLDYLNLF